MSKGKLGVIIALVVAALAGLGVIDKETARTIISATGVNPGTQAEQGTAPRNKTPSDPGSRSAAPTRPAAHTNKWHGWSSGKPEINLTHVFHGEINRSGKATGFHSRPDAKDPEGARINRIKGNRNRAGVYTAQVEIHDRQENRWKGKFSTFFPDRLSHQQVIESIRHAWKNRNTNKNTPWRGPSGKGFQIEGYVSRKGGINTAYPVYVRN